MYIERVPNRQSPPAVLLRESYRADGKIKKRTLANLTDWPTHLVEGLRTLIKGGVAVPRAEEALTISRSLPHGHVAAVLGMAWQLDLPKLLLCCRVAAVVRKPWQVGRGEPGKLLGSDPET